MDLGSDLVAARFSACYRRRMPSFRVAFVQGRPRFGQAQENLERGLALARTVEAELVVIPELWSSGYVFTSHREVEALAEDARDGATARALVAAAKRDRRHYVAGFPERARGRFYNSALLVGPAGIKAVYRKLHLFEREQEWFSPGDLPLEVHRVGPARVGMLICFDWRFPEAARVLALGGADVIAHPSNLVFPNAQEAMRVRALENRVYTVTANRTGTERRGNGPGDTVSFTGRSQVVDPDGVVVARAGRAAAVATAVDCDLARARKKQLTKQTPLFSNRRPEHYESLAARGRPRAARAGAPGRPRAARAGVRGLARSERPCPPPRPRPARASASSPASSSASSPSCSRWSSSTTTPTGSPTPPGRRATRRRARGSTPRCARCSPAATRSHSCRGSRSPARSPTRCWIASSRCSTSRTARASCRRR
jgi:predicted amidohydrolase